MMPTHELIRRLVQSFGGTSAMARALGHAHPSTVQGWKERGAIPRWRFYEIRNSRSAQDSAAIRDLLARLEEAERRGVVVPSDADEGCRYIHGDPKGTWRYCGAPRVPGSPYCAEHHALCRRPADDAASLAEIAAAADGTGDDGGALSLLLREDEA